MATRRGLTAHLDTHAAVFLFEGRHEEFGARSRSLLESAELVASPMVRLELAFLREVGKLKVDPETILGALAQDVGLSVAQDPFEQVVARAVTLSWTRDPFDRLIVASSLVAAAPLVTRDRNILAHLPTAVW